MARSARRKGRQWRGDRQMPERRGLRRFLDPRIYLSGIIGIAAALLILLPLLADGVNAVLRPASAGDNPCRILAVTDGDTVRLWCSGQVHRARIIGLDAPEKFSPDCPQELWAAELATWALRGMIWRAENINILRQGRDRYGRDLILLRLDGRDVAGMMIAAGHARAYDGAARTGWCG